MKKSNLINKNYRYFKFQLKIIRLLLKSGLYDDCILYIQNVSTSSWLNFNGLYTSIELENLISKIAQTKIINSELKSLELYVDSDEKNQKFSYLHLFSEVYNQGGHTKVIFNWAKNDLQSEHYFVSTRQDFDTVSHIAKENYNFHISDDRFYKINIYLSAIEKAKKILKLILENRFNCIVLHVNQNDIIPNLIFSNNIVNTPVYFFNHADHQFWLGSTIADFFISYRELSIKEDVYKRMIPTSKQFFIPLPIDLQKNESFVQRNNKKSNYFEILSIGAGYKYAPNREYNFFEAVLSILNENKNVRCTIIGIDNQEHYNNLYKHDRLKLISYLSAEKIIYYYQTSDLFLSSFPVGSNTALLEASFYNIPFVLMYNPYDMVKFFVDIPSSYIEYPKNLDDWKRFMNKMINDTKFYNKVKQEQQKYVSSMYSIELWKSKVSQLKQLTQSITHSYSIKSFRNVKIFNSRNEELLLGLHSHNFHHFSQTNNLSFFYKILVLFFYINSPKWVKGMSYKQIVKYFIPNYFKRSYQRLVEIFL
jgi:glycosyltransferase involved in cell wall biosynthesis